MQTKVKTAINTGALPEIRRAIFLEVCIFLLIALSPVQDFVLQATPLRAVGASPSFFPLLGICLYHTVRWLSAGDLKINRLVLFVLFYVLVTTLYGFLIFGLTSHGENLLWRATTSLVSLSLFAAAIFEVDYSNRSLVRHAVYAAFVVLILGVCFSSPTPLGLPALFENPLLHFTPVSTFLVTRPRGLSTEPSQFSITVIGIGLLCAHVSRSKATKFVFVALAGALLIASGSKGGILMLFVCAAILSIVRWHSKWYHVLAIAAVTLVLGFVGYQSMEAMFPEEAVSESGTVPTRLSMILCSFITVSHHPLGVGFSGFLPAVAKYLPEAMGTLQSYSPLPLNFDEVSEYLTSADFVSTKTFVFDQMMRFGIPFVVLFVLYVTKMLKRLADHREPLLFIAILACSIALATYIPVVGQYTTAVVFGIALNEVRSGALAGSSQ